MSGTFNDIDVPPTLVSFAVDMALERISSHLNSKKQEINLYGLRLREMKMIFRFMRK